MRLASFPSASSPSLWLDAMTTSPDQIESPSKPPAHTPSWREVVDRPGLLIAVLFLVTAALGLPLLWMSRGFSLTGKIVLTILVLLWTALVLYAFYLIMAWCLPRIWEGIQAL